MSHPTHPTARRHAHCANARAASAGFSLVELCVALAVAAVLAAIGVPAMATLRDSTVVTTQVQDVMSALRLARQEAMSRGEVVTACALDAASLESGGEPACREDDDDWSEGWLVFVDRGVRGEVDEGDRIVRVLQTPAGGAAVVGNASRFSYRATGAMLSWTGHLRVVPPSQPAVDQPAPGALLICVNKTGRPRVTQARACG